MPTWNSDRIIKDLGTLIGNGVKEIVNDGPGGDVDTDNIRFIVDRRNREWLIAVGFDQDREIKNPSKVKVPYVELSDGQDSQGGLNSDDPRMAQAYVKIRAYFRDQGFQVVNAMDDFF